MVTSVRAEPEVTVAFVPVKGGRPEWVVQKLTEAGVDRIVVLESLRAVVRWEGDRRTRAVDRLRRVAREAAAQSRRAWLPEVVGVADLDDLRDRLAPVPLALAQLGGDPPSIRAPAVAVGPEGGWDASEVPAPGRTGSPRLGLTAAATGLSCAPRRRLWLAGLLPSVPADRRGLLGGAACLGRASRRFDPVRATNDAMESRPC